MTNYALYIFDIDGTLCELDKTELLPKRKEIIDPLIANGAKIAIATNQGGVGYRLYRQQMDKSIDEFPTEEEVLDRISTIIQNIGCPVPYNIAFRYYIKWDKVWSPIPSGREDDPFWSPNFRKPNPGMLLAHMETLKTAPEETIYVGDRPEDEGAALAAGCQFMWACEFFGDNRPE